VGSCSPPLNSTVFCRIWGRQGGGRAFQQPLSAPGKRIISIFWGEAKTSEVFVVQTSEVLSLFIEKILNFHKIFIV